MGQARRLNLDAIEASLRRVQANFDAINDTLTTPRDPLGDSVLERLLLGYRRVDSLLAANHQPYALGNAEQVLELNYLVLCGRDRTSREDCGRLLQATSERFYGSGDGGIEALMVRLRAERKDPVWRRAASAYVQILSQPQLFVEGNHRTGALIMSWMLARAGKPPFVLSVENAKAYFDPSTLTKNARKHSLGMLLERPKLMKRFADLLKREADLEHVIA